jgi:RNA-directed DNA polymerase
MTSGQAAATALGVATPPDAGVANGPEELDFDAVDWRKAEAEVRRLRQRIFKAAQAGDLKQVRNLQKLALRSYSNTLVSVRRVTGRNKGRGTPGVDGQVALTSPARAELAVRLHRHAKPWEPLPVRRVYIPKKGGKRPLGIPVIADRVQQMRVRTALEPEWEAYFEPKSYGFRPGRGCHDAIEAIFTTCRGDNLRRWVADCDLSQAFDRIDHTRLLDRLGAFPAREQIRGWLKAGVVEKGRYAPTEEGTPQGGTISPLLLNIALHGMEEAAGVRYHKNGKTVSGSPVLVRYADDFVALCHTREQAEQVLARLREWLTPRGLSINEGKTRVVSLDEGFDFLGFTVRRYTTRHGGKLLIKPSKDAIKKAMRRLTAEVRSLRGANAAAMTARLNPVVRGWAAYYRPGVSSKAFSTLDNHLWHRLHWWARRSHRDKPERWVTTRYFGKFHPDRGDRWARRPRQRRLPAQVLLDPDHPAHPGQGHGVPGRPRPGRVLGRPAPQETTPPLGDGTCTCSADSTGVADLRDHLPHADGEPDSPNSGSNGSARSAKRSPNRWSPANRPPAPVIDPASYTPTAPPGSQPGARRTQTADVRACTP